jgi:putative sigma-54 modulation protein
MNIKFTARHFKAHDSLKDHATTHIENLTKFYDGILSAEVILSFEKVRDSIKIAEITMSVNGKVLKSVGKSEEFLKSIDIAVDKIEIQLKKYKEKKRSTKVPGTI